MPGAPGPSHLGTRESPNPRTNLPTRHLYAGSANPPNHNTSGAAFHSFIVKKVGGLSHRADSLTRRLADSLTR